MEKSFGGKPPKAKFSGHGVEGLGTARLYLAWLGRDMYESPERSLSGKNWLG
jgi:hypothetical protein